MGDYQADGLVNASDYNLWRMQPLGKRDVAPGVAADGNTLKRAADAGDYVLCSAKRRCLTLRVSFL